MIVAIQILIIIIILFHMILRTEKLTIPLNIVLNFSKYFVPKYFIYFITFLKSNF